MLLLALPCLILSPPPVSKNCAELLLQAKGEFGIVGQLNKLKDRISVLEREKAQLIVERDEEIVKKIDLKVKLDVKIGELKVSRKQHQEAREGPLESSRVSNGSLQGWNREHALAVQMFHLYLPLMQARCEQEGAKLRGAKEV